MYNMMDINTNYHYPMQWFQMQSMADPFAGQTNFMPGMNIGDTSLFMPMPYIIVLNLLMMIIQLLCCTTLTEFLKVIGKVNIQKLV